MQILDDQLARVVSSNTFYTQQKAAWRYYLESYLGGEDYRRGGHLVRYQLETDTEYTARLQSTPYENHCRSVIGIYTSFLFRKEVERDLGQLESLPETAAFLEDADLEGRSLDAFMKDVCTWSSVYGHAWVLVTKPNVGAVTRLDELVLGVRPYLSLITPLSVVDWTYQRAPNGYYELNLLKYIEDINGTVITIKIWTKESIVTETMDTVTRTSNKQEETPNALRLIPAVCVYNTRSAVKGLGISDLDDIADLCKFIYNMTSEVEQTQRLDAHPSLVKTPETNAGTGAGSIITMPENLDPGLKPYLLEYNGASVDSLYKSIQHAQATIDKLACLGAMRASDARVMSGISRQVEFQMLNAKLSEKARNLELAEEQIWQLFSKYMNMPWEGEIEYQDDFSIVDEEDEYKKLEIARRAATGPKALAVIDQKLIDLIGEKGDEEVSDDMESMSEEFVPHTMTNAAGEVLDINTPEEHRAALAAGYTE
jgi:hypothetical protein